MFKTVLSDYLTDVEVVGETLSFMGNFLVILPKILNCFPIKVLYFE